MMEPSIRISPYKANTACHMKMLYIEMNRFEINKTLPIMLL